MNLSMNRIALGVLSAAVGLGCLSVGAGTVSAATPSCGSLAKVASVETSDKSASICADRAGHRTYVGYDKRTRAQTRARVTEVVPTYGNPGRYSYSAVDRAGTIYRVHDHKMLVIIDRDGVELYQGSQI